LIDDELKKYPEMFLDTNFGDESTTSANAHVTSIQIPHEDSRESKRSGTSKTGRSRKYIPSHRSGAYAILLALCRHSGSTGFMSKEEIMNHGQQYSNHPFKIYDPSRNAYTAWMSMKTLLGKDLVSATSSRPIRYALTDEGAELAAVLNQSYCNTAPATNDLVTATSNIESAPRSNFQMISLNPDFNLENGAAVRNTFYEGKLKQKLEKEQEALRCFEGELKCIPSGSYDILLVLDSREVRKRSDRDFFQFELEKRGVPVLTKQMELGDICWVVRSKSNPNEMYILDYIIERKINDDLASSIMDSRFMEQKHRLSRCGISNLIYLVEGYDPNVFSAAAMTTALSETLISNDFFVKVTKDAQDTVQYLTKITKFLNHQYQDTNFHYLDIHDIKQDTHHALRRALAREGKHCLIPFGTFNSLNSKTKVITYGDLWQKQLLTIRGVSREKVRIITRRYPTFYSLISSLDQCSDEDAQLKIFTDLNLGPALAKKILSTFTLFC
jgi:crossover junction endonuclease MUS81